MNYDDDIDTHPLTMALDISEAYESFTAVEIPDTEERRNLLFMSDLALTAYKDIMNDLNSVKPESKNKMLQTALAFLEQAKDARYKADYIAVQWAKLNKQPGKTVSGSKEEVKAEEVKAEEVVPRGNLYDIAKGRQVGKG